MDIKIRVSVSDNLKESVSAILEEYSGYWKQLTLKEDVQEVLYGCVYIVDALNEAYREYSGFTRYFISDVFTFDFIKSFKEEEWFGRFLTADRAPQRYKARCLFNSNMVAEHIYGGISDKISLADAAKQNCLSEIDGQKIYDEFWTKTIEKLNSLYLSKKI